MNIQTAEAMRGLPRALLTCLLYLTVLIVLVPLNPGQPASGLDPSWQFALNQAIAQGLVFGKDLIFTFGPYASIYTQSYHPATDHLMVYGGLYLGICYASLLLFLTRAIPLRWLLAFLMLLAGYMFSRDWLLLSYPLLLTIAVYRITLPNDQENTAYISGKLAVFFVLLFTPLGLLPLIKGSLIPISGVVAILCFFIFWHSKNKALAYWSLLSSCAAIILFWLLSGQPLSGLPYFILTIIPIISGYTEAMASPGNMGEVIAYIIASVGILYVAGMAKGTPLASRLFLFFSFAIFLFTAFKGGFVRHDAHAILAGTCIIAAAILLNFTVQHKYLNKVLLLSVLVWLYIDNEYVGSSTKSIPANIENTYSNAYAGLKMRVSDKNKLYDNFIESIDAIKNDFPIATMIGTTDIYSYNQSYLLASGNKWSPRPVPQSYSAYTPRLAQLNASHLTGEHAPGNIIFKVEPIDGRLPALEDGLSWPLLLNNYLPDKLKNNFLYLTKKAARNSSAPRLEISSETHDLDEEVALPSSSSLLFAEVDIRPTLAGRLISVLYKPRRLKVFMELSDGRKKVYRIISIMAKSGFLISPLVENTNEFALLFSDPGYLNDKRVRSVRISPVRRSSIFWNSQYTLKLSKLELPTDSDIAKFIKLDAIHEKIPEITNNSPVVNCDGAIDTVNGVSSVLANIKASNTLSVEGWLAVSANDAVMAEAVFVTLTGKQGDTSYIRTRRTLRTDLKKHFKQPKMAEAGYQAYVDVSKLDGNYSLGLSRTYKGELANCRQFHLPVLIER